MRIHGWVGLLVIAGAEALLWAGHRTVGEWFTPIVWTGYVLFADAWVHARTGRSYLTTRRRELPGLLLASVACWWLFEWYNAPRFWRGGPDLEGLWWRYENLEPNFALRLVGYTWAFATIFPALFLTAAAVRAALGERLGRLAPLVLPPGARAASVAAGAVAVVLPLVVVSPWLVPLVWLGYVLLLEPLNDRRGAPSWLREVKRGDYRTLTALLASGLICGVLWEFWNYWALTRWTYTVPYGGEVKIFEMPVLGYLGFPPFALEAFAMYNFLRSRVPGLSHPDEEGP
jgi:hypothetical protein